MKFNIRGLIQSSMVDWVDKTCTVLFVGGCNLKCKYCYNRMLDKDPIIPYASIIDMLEKRKELVKNVVFSGGEPLHNEATLEFIRLLKKSGFHVGIHTNGTYPYRLSKVIDLVQFVGFDIKTSPSKYSKFFDSFSKINMSLYNVLNSGVDYEIRTTMDKDYLKINDYREIAEYLKSRNINKWTIKRQRRLNNTKNVMFGINNSLEKSIKNICKEFEIDVDIV